MGRYVDFYRKNYELKIFYSKKISDSYDYGLLFVYIYDNELENFRDTFGYYFPYYVKNEDQLSYLDPDDTDFESKLKKISIRNWKRVSIIPQRSTESSGIYGELFLDFYLRVVRDLDPLISYVAKRSYRSNRESTGIDNVMFDVDNDITIYLSEAKFVYDKSSAKTGLLDDIRGKIDSESHLSSNYLNDYMDFVIIKASENNQIKNELIKDFIDYANQQADNGKDFLDVCIEKEVRFHVVLFAIFRESQKDPNEFDSIYKQLSEELEMKLNALGVISYGYEIVFIPTNNTSMVIKEGINEYYE